MIEKESSSETKSPVDFMGAFKLAGVVIVGLLALIGFGWEDLMGEKKEMGNSKNKAETKSNKESDYEDTYLEEEIDEEALDEHTLGLS
jgi:hypothetical protein|tara:strand:+ start:1487 stop:1750 length:264 start_codon:yes stop_codon:yes gene_type:complete